MEKQVVIPAFLPGAHADARVLQLAAEPAGVQKKGSKCLPRSSRIFRGKDDVQVRAVIVTFGKFDASDAFGVPCNRLALAPQRWDIEFMRSVQLHLDADLPQFIRHVHIQPFCLASCISCTFLILPLDIT